MPGSRAPRRSPSPSPSPSSSRSASPGASPGSKAELSSLTTAVGELSTRVSAIADRYAGSKQDDVAAELYEVERSLTGAYRRLGKVADTLA